MNTPLPLYITTTLPYVNSSPHIGYALEVIQADVYARLARRLGRDVFFNVGTDEHGQKIFQKASEQGRDVQEYVDHYAQEFISLRDLLNLSFDAFIRTTDKKHIKAAQELWKRCEAQGDIYKKSFQGMYCVGCERYVSDKDFVDGLCPEHHEPPILLEEENYFFRLSKYQEPLRDYIRSTRIFSESYKHQALQFIEGGLEDFSISRLKEKMSWGIPVPNDDEHVMYVWFDALTNYISTLDWPETDGNFKKFWIEGERVQIAGKDQVRFQSIMWQAMLMSAGIPNTDTILYHGYIITNGRKMSKSLGNVIHPRTIVEEFGVDMLRYYLLRHTHPTEDSDVTFEKISDAYTAHLVNGIGNLTSRILTMYESYEVCVQLNTQDSVWEDVEFDEYKEMISEFRFNEALDYIWSGVNGLDAFIASEEPYKSFKTDPEKAKADVAYCYIRLYEIAVLLEPFMPHTSARIITFLMEGKKPSVPLFARK
jgi:methionyl-tRNA synthetase